MIVEKGCIEEDASKSNVGKTFAFGLLKKFGANNPQAVQVEAPVTHGDINMERFEKKLSKGEIDVEYLNQTLKADCEYILDDEKLFYGDDWS